MGSCSRTWIANHATLLRSWTAVFCCVLVGTAAGCQQTKSKGETSDIPPVPVSHPVEREVTDYVDLTGNTDAVQSDNIVARVTGYLNQMPFREGSEVHAGDLLFEIDPRPYQAQFDQAQAQVTLAQAQLDLAVSTLKRYQDLKKETPGAVSEQAIEQYQAAVTEAKARVNSNQKSLEVYKLNKEFTQVVSPIDGQVSRYFLTVGNLVNQDQTLLTTVVSLDRMYAYFDVDERTLLEINRAINQGLITWRKPDPLAAPAIAALGIGARAYDPPLEMPVFMGLQGEDGFPHEGKINFRNNQINKGTGSQQWRGVFDNPKPPGGVRLLMPGMFVRIRLPKGQPHNALLVYDRAIQSDQGHKYVFVVEPDSKNSGKFLAKSRRITTGALQENGQRVITGGLKKEDLVVVGALLQVRPNGEVKPDETPMPPVSQSDADDASAGKPKKDGAGKLGESKK